MTTSTRCTSCGCTIQTKNARRRFCHVCKAKRQAIYSRWWRRHKQTPEQRRAYARRYKEQA